jgi:hypothetical protein
MEQEAKVDIARKTLKLDIEKGLYMLRADVEDEFIRRIVTIKRDMKMEENRLRKWPEAQAVVKKSHRNQMLSYSRKTGVLKSGK